MKISIITINYNNLPGLKKTRESVVSQTNKEYEWVVIDGGSDDGSKEYIQEHIDEMSYWCSEKDNGVYNAMNKGIAAAQGDYFLFLNSGDYFVDKNVLQRVKDCWHQFEGLDIVYGDAFFCKGEEEHEEHYPEYFSLYDYWRIYTMCHQATFIRAALLREKGYDESFRIVADFKRWIEWKLEGRSFCHMPVTICRYQLDGISSTNLELHHKEHDKVMKELLSPLMLEQMKYIDDLKANYEKTLSVEIERRDQDIVSRDREIRLRDQEIKNRDKEIDARDQEIKRRDELINSQHAEMERRESFITSLKKDFARSQEKNRKHIKLMRVLLYACAVEILTIVAILLK